MIKEHGGNVYKVSRETGIPVEDIIDFSANINPLGVPKTGRVAIENAIDGLINYPDPEYVEFRKAVAQHHGVDYELIVPGNGAIDSLFTAVAATNPKSVLVSVPSFVEYEKAVEKIGAKYVAAYRNEENAYVFNVDDFISQINEEIDLVVLCNPNNPSGDLVAVQDIERILQTCRKFKAFFLLDEAFMEFAELLGGQSSIPLLKKYPELIVSRSLTKFFAVPGLRSGYLIVGDQAVRDHIRNISEPWKLNHFADMFSRAVVTDSEYLENTKEWLLSENSKLLDRLSEIDWIKVNKSYANYLFFKCLKDIDLKSELIKHGIMIRSCHNYDGIQSGYYRVAVKDAASNEKLIEALKSFNDM